MSSPSKNRKAASAEDVEFLEHYDASAFPRPSLAVDVALLSTHEGSLRALLVQRKERPQLGAWALPGGFVGLDESLDQAAQRVLASKADLDQVFIEQLYTFGAVERDPRTRVISVAYYALVDFAQLEKVHNGARKLAQIDVPWDGLEGGPVATSDAGVRLELAFDHGDILGLAVQRLRGKLDYAPIGFELLPSKFTLRALQEIHETIQGKPVNKDSFRRRMLSSGLIVATGEREQNTPYRPAELYAFKDSSPKEK